MEVRGCKLVIFLLSFTYKCCGQHGATVGLPTSIPCNGFDIQSPPFWFINGTVYELFSIPRHFPFIPVVTSFISLNIPYVEPVLDDTTFQCARFGEDGLENGTFTALQVFPRDTNSSAHTGEGELILNYQDLYILGNRTTVSWVLNDTCSERFQVQGYTLDTGRPVLSPEHVFDVGNSTSVVLPEHASNVSYKLVALDDNVTLCPSNQDIYYRFEASTESRFFDFTILNSPLCFPVPQTTIMCPGKALNFVWPARAEGRSCVCPVHNSSAGRLVFESCVEGCRDAILTPTLTEEGYVRIHNLSYSLNGSLYHFVCSTEPCGGGNPCFLLTVIASYNIQDLTHSNGTTNNNIDTNDETTDATTSETTTRLHPEQKGSSPLVYGIIILVVFLLVCLLLCICFYCFVRKKHYSTKRCKHIRKCVYNTNYVGVSSPRDNHTVTVNINSSTEIAPVSLLYEMIPGELTISFPRNAEDNQMPAVEQQAPGKFENGNVLDLTPIDHSSQVNAEATEGVYDTVVTSNGGNVSGEGIYNHLSYNSPQKKSLGTEHPQDQCGCERSKTQCSNYDDESHILSEPVYSSLQGCVTIAHPLQNLKEPLYSVVDKTAKNIKKSTSSTLSD